MNNVIQKVNNLSSKAKTGLITSSIILGSAVNAFASPATNQSVTDTITKGFTDAGSNVAVIIGLGVTATVGVVAMSGGAKAGLKWIKGVFSKAS